MVVGIVSIPLLLAALLAWGVAALARGDTSLPSFSQLPAEYQALTLPSDWRAAQITLAVRPPASGVIIFKRTGDSFQVLYSNEPSVAPGSVWTNDSLQGLFRQRAVDRNFIFSRLEDTSLYALLSMVRTGSPHNPLEIPLLLLGILVLSLLVFSLVWAMVMVNGSAKALVALNTAVRRVGKGDFDTPVGPLKGNDEIVELCITFDRLRLDLREARDQQRRFVMGISHDLRSPLTLVKGYVEALRDWPEADPAATDHHFALILNKVDQLDSMIDQLIDHGKYASGEWYRHQVALRFVPFLETLVSVTQVDARQLGREVEFRSTVEPDLVVTCDDLSVRRAFENLILNALRYIPEGGKVTVNLGRDGETLVAQVRDNGPGIAPEDLPYVFEAFYRGSPSRREPGLGLGLAIVQSVVDQHGWTIGVHNDGGAVFTVRIPPGETSRR
jgi:signal transduction histidine kinase